MEKVKEMPKIIELAEKRRSTRRYKNRPIKLKEILKVLEAANNAPSGGNRQPWRYLIITDRKKKETIRERCEEVERRFHQKVPEKLKRLFEEKGITWRKEHLTEAPILILLFGKTDEPYWKESLWISVGYILLAIEERGLASLTYTPTETEWTKEVFRHPKNFKLEVIIPVGESAEEYDKKKRTELKENTYINNWGKKIDE